MSEAFIGEIRMFAGNFAPRNWAFCDGQLLAVSGNDALFSLLGTIYGGDGRTTFGLPEMRGRLPIHAGSGAGPGLTARPIGQKAGEENASVSTNQLPIHTHTFEASTANSTQSNPDGEFLGGGSNVNVYRPAPTNADMNAVSIENTGGNGTHANVMPFLCVHFIIALTGTFPSRD